MNNVSNTQEIRIWHFLLYWRKLFCWGSSSDADLQFSPFFLSLLQSCWLPGNYCKRQYIARYSTSTIISHMYNPRVNSSWCFLDGTNISCSFNFWHHCQEVGGEKGLWILIFAQRVFFYYVNKPGRWLREISFRLVVKLLSDCCSSVYLSSRHLQELTIHHVLVHHDIYRLHVGFR